MMIARIRPAIPALMCTTVPPAKSIGATLATVSPSSLTIVPKIFAAKPFSEPDSSPPPQTMCASGKYARVTQIPAKASQVPYLTRPAIEPLIRATVMMANVTWNATSMTLA